MFDQIDLIAILITVVVFLVATRCSWQGCRRFFGFHNPSRVERIAIFALAPMLNGLWIWHWFGLPTDVFNNCFCAVMLTFMWILLFCHFRREWSAASTPTSQANE